VNKIERPRIFRTSETIKTEPDDVLKQSELSNNCTIESIRNRLPTLKISDKKHTKIIKRYSGNTQKLRKLLLNIKREIPNSYKYMYMRTDVSSLSKLNDDSLTPIIF
jgi:hypothetical protein